MSQADYEYGGLMASFWDLLRGDTSKWSDRFFYMEVIRKSGQPALDVGCGTGRLLLDFMEQGIDIDGVDNSPEMLAICREKAEKLGLHPTIYQQTMESLDIPRRYRTIIVPSSSFQLLTDLADAQRAMSRFFAHLQPGGTLVMPFMEIWDGRALVAEHTTEKVRPEDGAVVRRRSRSTFDVENQLEHTEDLYEVIRDGQLIASEQHRRSPATRWYTREQARVLYEEAGFENVHMTGDFTFNPATEQDRIVCVFGTRAGAERG